MINKRKDPTQKENIHSKHIKKAIDYVKATLAQEGMILDEKDIENLKKVAKNEIKAEKIIEEIIKEIN